MVSTWLMNKDSNSSELVNSLTAYLVQVSLALIGIDWSIALISVGVKPVIDLLWKLCLGETGSWKPDIFYFSSFLLVLID